MSLVRLLALNRGVDGNNPSPDRYKMSHPLPKFAPMKRSVSLAPRDKFKTEEIVMTTPSLFEQPQQSPAPQEYPAPGVLSVGVFQPTVAPAPVPVAQEKRQSWFARLKGLFARKAE